MAAPISERGVGMISKVGTKDGVGIVVGIMHSHPMRYDILLLDSGTVVPKVAETDISLIDSEPFTDPSIPESHRNWLRQSRQRNHQKMPA
jgi:hypothetical protein